MVAMTPQEIMQRALEELRYGGEPDELDELEPAALPEMVRNGYAFVTGKEEGLAQGREEGQLTALRRVLVDILAARGVEIAESTHARIEQCQDAAILARWCTRASAVRGALDDPTREPVTDPAGDRA